MTKKGPYELTERLARATLELAKEEELARERRAEELGSSIRHLRDLEEELVVAGEELGRIQRVIAGEDAGTKATRRRVELNGKEAAPNGAVLVASRRRVELNGKEAAPNGAVLVARRLIDGGHSPEEVLAFLKENFAGLNAAATVKKLFAEEATTPG